MLIVLVLPMVIKKLLTFGKITLIMYIIVNWMKSLVICFMKEFLRLPTPVTSVFELKIAINKQKTAKSPGPDSISMEAYMYGGVRSAVHLALLFNCFIRHYFLPPSFMDSEIIPFS